MPPAFLCEAPKTTHAVLIVPLGAQGRIFRRILECQKRWIFYLFIYLFIIGGQHTGVLVNPKTHCPARKLVLPCPAPLSEEREQTDITYVDRSPRPYRGG